MEQMPVFAQGTSHPTAQLIWRNYQVDTESKHYAFVYFLFIIKAKTHFINFHTIE